VTILLLCTLFCSGIVILLSLNLTHVMKPFVYLHNLLKISKLSGNNITVVLENYDIRSSELV